MDQMWSVLKKCWALLINMCPWSFPITTGIRASSGRVKCLESTDISCSMENRPEVLYKQAKVALDYLVRLGILMRCLRFPRKIRYTVSNPLIIFSSIKRHSFTILLYLDGITPHYWLRNLQELHQRRTVNSQSANLKKKLIRPMSNDRHISGISLGRVSITTQYYSRL